MTAPTQIEIALAAKAHGCTEEEAVSLGYAAQVAAHRAAERASNELNKYKQLRSQEYPPITDYIDGVVKGDQAQIDAYIAACQAVKAKYPKPE